MKRSDLPNLDDLRAFEATARLGSVRAAADELALTHAAVSRRNGRLADYAGAPLFRRAGRGLEMTTPGTLLRDACRRSFDDISKVMRTIRETEGAADAEILLSCERSIAMRWLIPRLSQFQDANPEIAVHLSVGGGAIDGHARRNLIALRRLDFHVTEAWSAKTIWPERMGPILAPSVAERFQTGDYTALGSATRADAWARWLSENPKVPRPKETRMFDHHFLMVEAACAGLGVGLAPFALAADDIERKRLIAPNGFQPDGTEYGLLTPSDQTMSASAQILSDWLCHVASDL